MKNIVDIFQSALGLNGISAAVYDILRILSGFCLQEDDTLTSCMCYCCHDGCC